MKNVLAAIATYAVLITVLLFDVDSGLHVATAPVALIKIGTVLGNLVWLFGVLLLILTGVMLYMTLHPNTIPGILLALHEHKEKSVERIGASVMNKIMRVVSVVIALIFMGSGYWFTGTAWLGVALAGYLYNYEYNRQVEKFLAMDEAEMTLYKNLYGK